MNIVLDDAVEEKPSGERQRLGMVVIRGNSVVMLEVCLGMIVDGAVLTCSRLLREWEKIEDEVEIKYTNSHYEDQNNLRITWHLRQGIML